MARPLLTNNATSTLSAPLADDETTCTIQTADAGLFPNPSGGDWFMATLVDGSGNREIVKVTARATAALTIERAQEGTSAIAFDAGDRIDARFTGGVWDALWTAIGLLVAKTLTLTAGNGLQGGGDLSANRSFALDYASEAEAEAGTDAIKAMTPATADDAIQARSPLPRGYIDGFKLENDATDVTNDIKINVGKARSSGDAVNMALAASLIKRLDANWAPGTNQGMRYSGAAIANAEYNLYCASKADGTTDIYADASASLSTVLTHLQAESGGEDYLYLRRIGSIFRASSAIRLFTQRGDHFSWRGTVPLSYDGSLSNSRVLVTLAAPPNTLVRFRANMRKSAGSESFSEVGFGEVGETDATTSLDNGTVSMGVVKGGSGTDNIEAGVHGELNVDASAQIAARANGSGFTLRVSTLGYTDPRGKDA